MTVEDVNVSNVMAQAAAGAVLGGIDTLAAQNSTLMMVSSTEQALAAAYTTDPEATLANPNLPFQPDPNVSNYNPYVPTGCTMTWCNVNDTIPGTNPPVKATTAGYYSPECQYPTKPYDAGTYNPSNGQTTPSKSGGTVNGFIYNPTAMSAGGADTYDDAYQVEMINELNQVRPGDDSEGDPLDHQDSIYTLNDWINGCTYRDGYMTNDSTATEVSQQFILTIEGIEGTSGFWDVTTGPTTMNLLNNVMSEVSAAGQQDQQILQNLLKMEQSMTQQAATAGQPYSDAATSTSGIMGNTASLLQQSL